MSKTDDQLISQFMQANKHEIADNGFSRRVMHRLPMSASVMSDILNAIGIVMSIVLFIAFDGVNVILESLHSFFHYQAWTLVTEGYIHLSTLLPALAVLAILGIYGACTVKE